jgi:hypothetical protein
MKKRTWRVEKLTEEYLIDVLCNQKRFESYMNVFGLDRDELIKFISLQVKELQSQK